MPDPLIGVTAQRIPSPQGLPQHAIGEAYIQALSTAGADPVLIPLGLPDSTLENLLSRLDGILFSGGGDIHPQQYGSQLHPLVAGVDPDRDRVELRLAESALRMGLPFLGICRGLQLINVALGGTLYEDILDQLPGAIRHDFSTGNPRNYLAHTVTILAGCRLSHLVGSSDLLVNSLHHQGIRVLAAGLQATAHSPDGLTEAFELPDYPFGLAVQWHPEWLQEHESGRAIFRGFVEACQRRYARR
jgi:putative glutamine amidotransferase